MKSFTFSKFTWILISLATLLLDGCKNFDEPKYSYLPGINLPLESMNTQIKPYVPPEANSFHIGDFVAVVIENHSLEPIVFLNDYGATIFSRKNDSEWIKINNILDYPEGNYVLYPQQEEPLGGILATVYPEIQSNKPINIRLVFIGKTQDTLKDVGAYIDITLNP
jgi:hypothetical protein